MNLAIIATFGSILWATSDGLEEAEFYRETLAEYRWMLRVSSKAAEFMKFTVGMLDSSAVFLKERDSKNGTPQQHQQQPTQEQETVLEQDDQHSTDIKTEQALQDLSHAYHGVDEVSPSVGTSTENAYPYEAEYSNGTTSAEQDTRPSWSALTGLANNVNFSSGDVQDWSLDQLYNFENFPLAEDILSSRRFIQEYDERGNSFAGF